MHLETTNFGTLTIKEEDVITFPEGIPAFEHLRRFIIIDHGDDSPFHFLQSIEQGDLSFVTVEPLAFFPHYRVKLSKNQLSSIEIAKEEEAVILAMVTIPADAKQMTANLQAPLVINGRKKLARQIILADSEYTTKHRLFPHSPVTEIKE